MALPSPLPDDPRKWDGWKSFASEDFYARLCLSFDERPSANELHAVAFRRELDPSHSRHPIVQHDATDDLPKSIGV